MPTALATPNSPMRTPSLSSGSSSDPDTRPLRSIRMCSLLNPSDEDDTSDRADAEPEAEADQGLTHQQPPGQLAKVPKKRGRKPILPKMNNSERGKYYRAKRKVFSGNLADEVLMLLASVARLTSLRNICDELALCPRNTIAGSLVKLVREYFVQFRHGVQLPPSRRDMTQPEVATSTAQQNLFMLATMDPSVNFGEFKGIHVIMDQWERYSKFHAFLQFELLQVSVTENATGHIVETVGQLRTRYSRRTIENVFPHVIGNEPLIQRLIGKEVVYPCRNQFYFTQDGRIQRYDVEADFPEALQKAIGRLDDVALLLGQALIREQHMMGELDGEEAAIVQQLERRVQTADECMDVEYLV